MNLTEICRKYNISESFLNSKDDGMVIAVTSIQDLIREVRGKNGEEYIIKRLERLAEFLREVKNSTF
jgi:hypothetical protein